MVGKNSGKRFPDRVRRTAARIFTVVTGVNNNRLRYYSWAVIARDSGGARRRIT